MIDAKFAGPDGGYVQKFLEVIFSKNLLALLQPVIIQYKAFTNVLVKDLSSSDAELCGSFGTNPIPNRDDGVKSPSAKMFLRYKPMLSGVV